MEPSDLNQPSDRPTAQANDEVARALVFREAVSFRTDPFFVFTSGVESPIYVDNRRLLGYPDTRRMICSHLLALAETLASSPFGAVAGTATAGIPWAAWIADDLQLPLLYVRSAAKGWGHERAVEGTAPAGASVLLVEDLFYTAGSSVSSTKNLRDTGFLVQDCVAIVTYETVRAAHSFRDIGLNGVALTTVDQTINVAFDMGTLSADQAKIASEWLSTVGKLA